MTSANQTLTPREEKLQQLLQSLPASPSHDRDHLQNVMYFGRWLAGLYQGNAEVVTAAAMLHDTARSQSEVRGTETAVMAADTASSLLEQSGYSREDVAKITQAIREHDDPNFHSELLESRILKDADFLDGFGARGILRSVMYAGETGGGVAEAMDRFQRKMVERLHGLEFVESRRLAWQLHRLTEVFLMQLRPDLPLDHVVYPGKLIVLEGISGSGKDTQAELLKTALETAGHSAVIMHHPTAKLKQLWTEWQATGPELMSHAFLTFADRFAVVINEMLPALKAGSMVISSRSTWSAEAYQAHDDASRAFYRFCASWEPVADAIIHLKIDPAVALARTQDRAASGQETPGIFSASQSSQAEAYKLTAGYRPNVVTVDASVSAPEVHQLILAALASLKIVI